MDFTFTQDQLAFRDSIHSVLEKEVTTASIRTRWQSDHGEDSATIAMLNELGVMALLVPEAQGGLGMDWVDFILLAESCGYAALPETIVDDAMVATGVLTDLLSLGQHVDQVSALLSDVATGAKRVGCAHIINPYSNFAHRKDWMLLSNGNDIHLVPRSDLTLSAVNSVDKSRRLQKIQWTPSRRTRVAEGEVGAGLLRAALNRGALGTAAQLLGLAQAMIHQSVAYTSTREQFGRAIGANQAVKHLLADCAVSVEFARPAVYRAAYTVSVAPQRADWAVSHAKSRSGRSSGAVLSQRDSSTRCDGIHLGMRSAYLGKARLGFVERMG